jgi:stalled ribosome rescue protein Dom34
MKYIGVWIDKDKAHIVTIDNGKESFSTISSEIEHFKAKGGSGQRFKSGPQDVTKDSKFLEREKQQFKKYFKNIVEEIKDTDALVIFGPAGTNEKFKKELDKNYNALNTKVKDVVKTDSMTNNQIIAWVRDYFKLN